VVALVDGGCIHGNRWDWRRSKRREVKVGLDVWVEGGIAVVSERRPQGVDARDEPGSRSGDVRRDVGAASLLDVRDLMIDGEQVGDGGGAGGVEEGDDADLGGEGMACASGQSRCGVVMLSAGLWRPRTSSARRSALWAKTSK